MLSTLTSAHSDHIIQNWCRRKVVYASLAHILDENVDSHLKFACGDAAQVCQLFWAENTEHRHTFMRFNTAFSLRTRHSTFSAVEPRPPSLQCQSSSFHLCFSSLGDLVSHVCCSSWRHRHLQSGDELSAAKPRQQQT